MMNTPYAVFIISAYTIHHSSIIIYHYLIFFTMKKVLLSLLACLMVSLSIHAQAPQTINFQAVIRNNAGDVIKNQSVRFRLSITEGLNGAVVFSETHQATTNALGLVNISIGTGSVISGIMASLNWSGVQKYLKIEVDVTGGTNFTLMGTQQLVSVPYSLFADKAGSVLNQWQFNVNGIHYNGGKVGIGTALPEAKLSLVGDETGVTPDGVPDTRRFLYLNNKSAGQYSTVFSQFQAGASNTNTTLGHHASGYYVSELADFGQLWSTGKGLVLRASPPTATEPNTSIIKFMTGYSPTSGSNERMRITETGSVGIGTNTPIGKVTIQENGDGLGTVENRNFLTLKNTSTSSASSTNMFLYAGNSNNFTVLNHNASTYSVQSGYADVGILSSTGPGLVLRSDAGVLRFETGLNGILHNERMRITNDGNVGIGTTLPKAKLEVQNGDVYVNDPTKGIILKSPNAACWRVTIDNTGNFVRTSITCPN
jgi:hypothetical protein